MTSHEVEKQALLGDRQAVIKVVSALRQYRAAAQQLEKNRHFGGVDHGNALVFADAIKEIEDALEEED